MGEVCVASLYLIIKGYQGESTTEFLAQIFRTESTIPSSFSVPSQPSLQIFRAESTTEFIASDNV